MVVQQTDNDESKNKSKENPFKSQKLARLFQK